MSRRRKRILLFEGAPDEEPVETTGIEDWTVEDAGNETVEADDNTEASDDGEQAQAPDTEEDQKTPEVDNGDAYDPLRIRMPSTASIM